MNIYIKLKSIGKRRPILENVPYDLPEGISSLRQLIEVIVRQEVDTYNSRGLENMLVPFLTEIEIAEQSTVGKVGFGRLYSDKRADPDKAVETALQGFEDGLFRMLINDKERADDNGKHRVRTSRITRRVFRQHEGRPTRYSPPNPPL